MSRFHSAETVEVRVGECQCPGTPHDADVAHLRPKLLLEGGLAASVAIDDFQRHLDQARLKVDLGMAFVLHGIVGWNFLDDSGKEVPVTEQAIRALDWGTTLYHIADRADDLYGEAVFAPLLASQAASSRNGSTAPSTSRKRTATGSRSTSRKRPTP